MSVDLKLFAAHTEAAAWLTVPAQEWMASGSCTQSDPTVWHPENIGETYIPKRICNGTNGRAGCPVRDECLEYALAHDEQFGVWGGMDATQRRRINRDKPRQPGMRNRNANGHGWSCKCTPCQELKTGGAA